MGGKVAASPQAERRHFVHNLNIDALKPQQRTYSQGTQSPKPVSGKRLFQTSADSNQDRRAAEGSSPKAKDTAAPKDDGKRQHMPLKISKVEPFQPVNQVANQSQANVKGQKQTKQGPRRGSLHSPQQVQDARFSHFQKKVNLGQRINSKNPTSVGAGSAKPNTFAESFNAIATLTSIDIGKQKKGEPGKAEAKKSVRVRFQGEENTLDQQQEADMPPIAAFNPSTTPQPLQSTMKHLNEQIMNHVKTQYEKFGPIQPFGDTSSKISAGVHALQSDDRAHDAKTSTVSNINKELASNNGTVVQFQTSVTQFAPSSSNYPFYGVSGLNTGRLSNSILYNSSRVPKAEPGSQRSPAKPSEKPSEAVKRKKEESYKLMQTLGYAQTDQEVQMINYKSRSILQTLTPISKQKKGGEKVATELEEIVAQKTARSKISAGVNTSTDGDGGVERNMFVMRASELSKLSEMSDATRGLMVSALHSGQMKFQRGNSLVVSNIQSNRNKATSYMAYKKNQNFCERFTIDHAQILPNQERRAFLRFSTVTPQGGSDLKDPEETSHIAGGVAPGLSLNLQHQINQRKYESVRQSIEQAPRSKSTMNTYEGRQPMQLNTNQGFDQIQGQQPFLQNAGQDIRLPTIKSNNEMSQTRSTRMQMERMEEYLRQTATGLQPSTQAPSTTRSKFKLRNDSMLQKLQTTLTRKIIAHEDQDYLPRDQPHFTSHVKEQISQKLRIKKMMEKINSTLAGTQMSEMIKYNKVTTDGNDGRVRQGPSPPPRRVIGLSTVYSPMKYNLPKNHFSHHNSQIMLHDPSIQHFPHQNDTSKASLAHKFGIEMPQVLSDVYQQKEVDQVKRGLLMKAKRLSEYQSRAHVSSVVRIRRREERQREESGESDKTIARMIDHHKEASRILHMNKGDVAIRDSQEVSAKIEESTRSLKEQQKKSQRRFSARKKTETEEQDGKSPYKMLSRDQIADMVANRRNSVANISKTKKAQTEISPDQEGYPPGTTLKRHLIQVTSAEDFNMVQSHKTLALLKDEIKVASKVRVHQPEEMSLIEGYIDLTNDQVVQRLDYNDSLQQLLGSVKPAYANIKYGKMGFGENNKVAAVDDTVDPDELEEEQERRREERRIQRIEQRLKENGGKTPSDLDEIDGISSRSSVDAENGKYNFDAGLVDKFQAGFEQQVLRAEVQQRKMQPHPAAVPFLQKAMLQRFGEQCEAERREIAARNVDEDAGLNIYKPDDEEQADRMHRLRSVGDLKDLKKADVQREEDGIRNEEVERYMQELDASYDPLEMLRQKKQFVKADMKKALRGEGTRSATRDDDEDDTYDYDDKASQPVVGPDVFQAASRKAKTNKFINKMKVGKMMKMQSDAAARELFEQDPKFKFLNTQIKNNEVPQGLLEGIENKTLSISDEALSKGLTEALCDSCKNMKDFASKIVLDKNKMTDDQFSRILDALHDLRSFRSIVYRNNVFGMQSVGFLEPFLRKRLPNHLEELKIENCQVGVQATEELVDILNTVNSLRSLSLVKFNMNKKTFRQLAYFVAFSADSLEEFDISQNYNQSTTNHIKMLKAISRHRRLKHVNISGNQITRFESKKEQDQEQERKLPLTYDEKQVLKYLIRLVQHSEQLQHLNVSDIGLKEQAIYSLCTAVSKSSTIQSVHLSGNPGLRPQPSFYQKIADIFGIANYYLPKGGIFKKKNEDESLSAATPSKDQNSRDDEPSSEIQGGGLHAMVPRHAPKRPPTSMSYAMRKKHLEDASELKMIDTKLLRFKGCAMEQEAEYKGSKLVVQRILGFENVCTNAHKWVLECGPDAQCWICDCWKLSIVLWNERIGASGRVGMAEGDVNPLLVEKPFQARVHLNDIATAGAIPQYYGAQTYWLPVPMKRIEDLCDKIDEDRPDFLHMMKRRKQIAMNVSDPVQLPKREKRVYDGMVAAYFKSYAKIFAEVFANNLKFKKVSIVNQAHPEVFADDCQLYCHAMFLKPGKLHYLVRQDNQQESTSSFIQYQALLGVRDELLPDVDDYQIRQERQKAFKRDQSVFADFKVDNDRVIASCFEKDRSYWKIQRLTKNPQDMRLTMEVLLDNYKFLKDLFITVIAKSTRYPCMSMMDFAQFFQQAGLIDHNLQTNAVDRAFIAANVTVSENEAASEQTFKDFNPDNLMVRYEFVEGLVRAAQIKYQLPRNVPKPEKKLNIAVQKLINVLKSKQDRLVLDAQAFRDEQLWNKKLHLTFKKHEFLLRKAMEHLVRDNDFTEKYLNLDNMFTLFCHGGNGLGLTQHDITFLYAHSKITNMDECNDQSPYRYNRLRFVEFIELIARVAQKTFSESEYDDTDLQWKVTHVLGVLLRPWESLLAGKERRATEGSESEESEY